MQYDEDSPFYKLLATKYKSEEEDLGIAILQSHPEIAKLEWPSPDEGGQPFVKGSTALHYAANDGKDIGLSLKFSDMVRTSMQAVQTGIALCFLGQQTMREYQPSTSSLKTAPTQDL